MSDRSRPHSPPRPRLVFVINSIGGGGAERVLDTVLRAAGDRVLRYDIHLVLLDRAPEARTMPPLYGRHCLDAGGSLARSTVRLWRLLRRLRPALVVSLLVRANLATALAAPALGISAILCERMHLGSHLRGRYAGWKLWALERMPRRLYPRASHVLAVSSGVAADLVEHFGVPPVLLSTINNPYDVEAIAAAGREEPEIALPATFIVAVGRLVHAKGFVDLIDAYAKAAPDWPLVILGEGPDRPAFEARIAAAGLAERILLAGFLANPFAVVARAAFLVSASHNEGFPNAIAEAMALGRPILASDCPSGPAELLGAVAGRAGEVVEAPFGLVVRDADVAGLAAGMRRLTDPALRARLGAAARMRIDDYHVERIAAEYWTVFDRYLTAG